MGNLHLEVVTPEKVVVSEEVDMVVAPGSFGEFGVLPGHVPFLTGIQPGELRFTKDGKSALMTVSVGFSEVSEDKVSILVDAAEKSQEIDLERARQAMDRARERMALDRGKTDVDFTRAEIALKRAVARIKVAEKAN